LVSFEGRVFQTRYTPVTDKTGAFDGFIGVATDLTEQVRAEEERRVLEAQLQHSQKLESLGVLAGGIAHDFNNLLTTILGYSELVLAELPPTSPSQAKLERIQRAARNAAGLTSQLLAYSGSTQLEVRPIDLSALVSDMADLLRVSISKKASLACELDQNLPAIEADAAQITQVVLNLITNASESLSDSNGSIFVRTGLRQVDTSDLSKNYLKEELSEGPYVFLEVRDTGVGMDEETRRRIFDPFFSTKFVGRGLGLATTLGIVRRHRGGLSVESEPGKGTVFRVLLPCGARAVEAGSALPGGAASWRGSGTVLVVDDESDVRQLAREMLESLGFQVVTASHGREALEVFPARAEEIAIVLLDVTMPELSGEETALRLAKIRPETPIVLMSGYRQTYAASRLRDGIPAGFLHKPFDRDALVGVLRNLVPGSGS
jgi:signal transduction histidine kinase/CheY-like chemotaxis protein